MGAFRFSTADFAERDRVPAWREAFGRQLARLDMSPLGDGPFHGEATVDALPNLTVASICCTPSSFTRTSALVPHDSDDVIVGIMLEGEVAVTRQGGNEVTVRRGDAVVWTNAAPSLSYFPVAVRYVGFGIPRSVLVPSLVHPDRAALAVVPRENAVVGMLAGYARLLLQDPAPHDVRALASAHVHDLVSVALGASRDAAEVAGARGVRAARLRALKADIALHLTDRDLNINTLAARHGLAPRTVRAIFQDDGTTFADLVLQQRLARVHRLLTDPRHAARTISALVYDSGFGDLSYFNHAFRNRYGATPSDVRAGANNFT